ncbi:MAG: hypothetical protein KDD47_04795, partial [Acidobacteria bacterium]|nr:hypothetical protein [Acidobacteriota bacterium]
MRALTIPSLAAVLLAFCLPATAQDVLLWPEAQRAFFQDGPASLLSDSDREVFEAAPEEERGGLIGDFLARSPELAEGIRRRQLLIREFGFSPIDIRGKLLFLMGRPTVRRVVDCGVVFRPMELWGYGDAEHLSYVVVHQPVPDEMYRLWLPTDGKRVLYSEEMEYFLDQWEELRRFITGRRFDRQICKEAKEVDRITGISALTGYLENRPTDQDMLRFLEPPANLEGWAREAASTELEEPPPKLAVDSFDLFFPAREEQRMVARAVIRLPEDSGVKVATEVEEPELDLSIEGTVEREGKIFDSFRVRFNPKAPEEPTPLALVLERALRPSQSYLLRLRVKDEVGGAVTWVEK